jgi:cell division septation protein DedD
VPRIVNLVCDRVLEIGHSNGATAIDRRLVTAAARDLELPIPSALHFPDFVSLRPAVSGAGVAAVVVAAIAVWFAATRTPWPVWSSAWRSAPKTEATDGRSAVSPAVPAADAQTASAASKSAAPPADTTPRPTTLVQTATAYELTVASFETAGRAASTTRDLVGRGHPARVARSGPWNVVIVGPYTSLPEALTAKDTLAKSGFPDIRIVKSP